MKSFTWTRCLIIVCAVVFVFQMQVFAADTDALVVTDTGNVGIGIAEPQHRLEVDGTIKAGELTIGPWPRNADYVFFGSDELDQYQDGNYALLQSANDGRTYLNSPLDIRFRINNQEQMVLTNGRLGINGRLVIEGQIMANNSDIYFTKTDHTSTGIGSETGMAAIQNAANYNALMILGRAGTSKGRYVRLWDYLQINGSMDITGKVGIGTTNPADKLDVAGYVRSNGVRLTSDVRWKDNINPVENSLERITQLRGVTYEWTDNSKGEGRQIGVIAQEVEETFPEVVHTDNQGYKSVEYSKLVAPLIEAVKDLKLENDLLKERIARLEEILAK